MSDNAQQLTAQTDFERQYAQIKEVAERVLLTTPTMPQMPDTAPRIVRSFTTYSAYEERV